MNELIHIRYNHLSPWEGLNPRQYFDPVKGQELQGSIREHGIQETLLVAAVEGKPGEYKVIAGERRWRETQALLQVLKQEIEAATDIPTVEKLKALVEDRMQVPCAVIPPEKVPAALELNLVENLCRADITPLEEAEGYERLRKSTNQETGMPYTIEEVARKVGKEPSYVRRRMKLRLAPAFFLDAVNEGLVAATIAEKLGKIPDPKAREEAARLILKPVAPAPEQEVPLNYEQAAQLIRECFMVKIGKGCGFDPADAELVPVKLDAEGVRLQGGSCRDCLMRSGNLTELDEEFSKGRTGTGKGKSAGIDPDLCTHPGCFKMKQDAAWMQQRRAAEAANKKVIDGDAARKVFSGHGGRIAYDSNYSELESKPDGYEVGYSTPAAEMTMGELIEGTKVDTVVARNPHTGKVQHLVDTKRAIEAAKKAKPELFKRVTEAGGAKTKVHVPSKEELERKRKQDIETKARAFIMELAAQRLKVVRPDDAEVNALLLEIVIESWSSYGAPEAMGGLLDLSDGHIITTQWQEAMRAEVAKDKKDPTAARRWLQTIVVAQTFEGVDYGQSAANHELVRKMGKVLGVDVVKCFAQAEEGLKAEGQEGTEAKGTKAPSQAEGKGARGKGQEKKPKPKVAKKAKPVKAAKKAKTKTKGKRSE